MKLMMVILIKKTMKYIRKCSERRLITYSGKDDMKHVMGLKRVDTSNKNIT